jgi:hypothetical protein
MYKNMEGLILASFSFIGLSKIDFDEESTPESLVA